MLNRVWGTCHQIRLQQRLVAATPTAAPTPAHSPTPETAWTTRKSSTCLRQTFVMSESVAQRLAPPCWLPYTPPLTVWPNSEWAQSTGKRTDLKILAVSMDPGPCSRVRCTPTCTFGETGQGNSVQESRIVVPWQNTYPTLPLVIKFWIKFQSILCFTWRKYLRIQPAAVKQLMSWCFRPFPFLFLFLFFFQLL